LTSGRQGGVGVDVSSGEQAVTARPSHLARAG